MARRKTPQGNFPETLEKDVLRERDRFFIEELAKNKKRRLYYLGLSGINAADVLKWQDSLDRVFVIERPISNREKRINFRTELALRLAPLFNGNIQIEFSDIWEFLASVQFAKDNNLPDIINLDFCGGIINEVIMEYPKQREAFQNVFSAAASIQKEDFLVLITVMPRDRGKDTYKKYLQEHCDMLARNAPSAAKIKLQKSLEESRKFHERSNLALFKVCLPLLLEELGRSHNFRVKPAYVRLYTKMIHFCFRCEFVSGRLGLVPDPASLLRYLNDPLRKLLPDGRELQEWPPLIRE